MGLRPVLDFERAIAIAIAGRAGSNVEVRVRVRVGRDDSRRARCEGEADESLQRLESEAGTIFSAAIVYASIR